MLMLSGPIFECYLLKIFIFESLGALEPAILVIISASMRMTMGTEIRDCIILGSHCILRFIFSLLLLA